MATGYTRQSTAQIVDGQVINASDSNNEFNLLQSFASGTTGHDHSGGTGLGPPISLTLTATGVTGVLDAKFGGIRTSASDPSATDDTPDYVVGSIWVNTTSKAVFRCTDNTSTAAVWTKLQGVSSASAPAVTDDIDQGYVRGSIWVHTTPTPTVVYICIDNTNGAAIWYPVPRGRTGVITGATTIPTTAEDSTAGYSQGSIILNSTQGTFYLCTSASAGAATWVSLASGRTGVSASAPTTTDDINKGYAQGSVWVETTTPNIFICTSSTANAAAWATVTFNLALIALAAQVFGRA